MFRQITKYYGTSRVLREMIKSNKWWIRIKVVLAPFDVSTYLLAGASLLQRQEQASHMHEPLHIYTGLRA